MSVVEDGVDEPGAEKGDEGTAVLYRFDLGVCFLYDAFIEMGNTVDAGCLALNGDRVDVVVVAEDADEGWQPVWRLMVFHGQPDVVGEETVVGQLVAEPIDVVMVAFHLDEMDARRKAGFEAISGLLELLVAAAMFASTGRQRIALAAAVFAVVVVCAGSSYSVSSLLEGSMDPWGERFVVDVNDVVGVAVAGLSTDKWCQQPEYLRQCLLYVSFVGAVFVSHPKQCKQHYWLKEKGGAI